MERQHLTSTFDLSAIKPIDLSARDLDRMVAMQRRADDPTLGAYAPDPDADWDSGYRTGFDDGKAAADHEHYARGLDRGFELGGRHPIQWMPRTPSRGDQLIKLALVVVFIGGLTWLALL